MINSTWTSVLLSVTICTSTLLTSVRCFHPLETGLREEVKSPTKEIAEEPEHTEELLKYFVENQPAEGHKIQALEEIHGNDYDSMDSDDIEKRRNTMDFLRFGRNDIPLISAGMDLGDYDVRSMDKKAPRNFLRFGRGSARNFLRFGRSGGPLEMAYGLENGLTESEEKRARNFLRFGRGENMNFLRFGRAQGRNFLRFGRSVSEEKAPVDEKVDSKRHQKSENTPLVRSKRSSIYDDALFMTQAPLTLPNDLRSFVLGKSKPFGYNNAAEMPIPLVEKRGRPRNFLRYGRDPLDLHFLRFGKRSSNELYHQAGQDGSELNQSAGYSKFG